MNWRTVTRDIMRAAATTFGEDVEYRPANGSPPFTVRAIFQEAHTEADPEGTASFSTVQPRVDLTRADLPTEPEQGDILLVEGRLFRVFDKQYDGWAMVRLYLMEI